MNEGVKETSKSPERLTEALLLPGSVYWINDDPKLRSVVADIQTGAKTKIPFVFPMKERSNDDDAEEELIVAALHRSHRRHLVLDTPHNAAKIVLKGTGLTDRESKIQEWFTRHGGRDKEDYAQGLCDISEAVRDVHIATSGNKYGGHFGIPLAILSYDTLPYMSQASKKIQYANMSMLREMGLIRPFHHQEFATQIGTHLDEDFTQAVCYARMLLSNVRLGVTNPREIRAEIERLMPLFKLEDPSVKDIKSGLLHLANKQAKNLGILHGRRLVNPELGMRNLTVAGEMVDLSACRSPDYEALFSEEAITLASYILEFIEDNYKRVGSPSFLKTIEDEMNVVYEQTRAYVEKKEYGSNAPL